MPSTQVNIVNSEAWHVASLKGNLRPEDVKEIVRLGVSVEKALWHSYKNSIIRKTAFIDGEVVAMWGCRGDILGQIGQPWLLTAPEVNKISPLKFARIYQEQVYNMLDLFQTLENYCDSSYHAAIRLLEIVGFHVHVPKPLGENLAMFSQFTIKRA